MLNKLPKQTLECLLGLFIKIFDVGCLPNSWQEAIVIPMLKQGKDPFMVANYQPKALTSRLCKLFEKIVNRRIIHFLEYNGKLDTLQAGFCADRSTTDNMVLLESFMRETPFFHNQYCLSVFSDLEKAYDTAWQYGMVQNLTVYGISRNMLLVIQSYLSDQKFQVRIGNRHSRTFVQENGVPH